MTAKKFEAMLGAKEPKTEALRRFRETLMARMGDCADALSKTEGFYNPAHDAFYKGKMDGFASCLGLLDTLGKQIEEEAIKQGWDDAEAYYGIDTG